MKQPDLFPLAQETDLPSDEVPGESPYEDEDDSGDLDLEEEDDEDDEEDDEEEDR